MADGHLVLLGPKFPGTRVLPLPTDDVLSGTVSTGKTPSHDSSSRYKSQTLPEHGPIRKPEKNDEDLVDLTEQHSCRTPDYILSSPSAVPLVGPYPNQGQDITDSLTENEIRLRRIEKVLTGPFDYIYGLPGKNIRGQMIDAFNEWMDVPPDSLEVINEVIGMLHTASLLVDDVEDDSLLRRGHPVAHSIFGMPQAINSANYMYFRALEKCQTLRCPNVIRIFTEEMLQLHRGQGMDLHWRDTLSCPTEREYLEMVGNKTGGLFRLAVKLMQAESPHAVSPDCVKIANDLGILFQIRDDYQNLASKDYSDSKGAYEDLTEGKFSFPIIHSIHAYPMNLELLHVLKQKTANLELKRHAVQHLERAGSFEYTRNIIHHMIARVRDMADGIGGKEGKSESMHKLLDKLIV